MTTAYTSLLGLALPVQGELSGTWGTVVNDSITSLLDTSVAGTTNISTDANVTLTTTTGASNQARQAILLFSGARTAIRTVTAPAQSKIYTVINATTGGFAVTLVGAGPTTGLTIPNGASATVAWNGSDFIEIGTSSIGNLTVNGNLTVTGVSTFSAGTAAAPAITTAGDTNTGIFFPAADTIAFAEGGVEAARLDSSGNLGLGVTPSAWTTFSSVLQGAAYSLAGFSSGSNVQSALSCNSFYNSNYKYITTAAASQYLQISGQHQWFNAPSGTAGNAITFTQAMTLDASGNLGIGTTSPACRLDLNRGSAGLLANFTDGVNTNFQIGTSSYLATIGPSADTTAMAFKTSNAERARIDSSGNFGVGTTSPSAKFTVVGTIKAAAPVQSSLYLSNAAQTNGFLVGRSLGSTDAQDFFIYDTVAAATRMAIDSSGNLLVGTTDSSQTTGVGFKFVYSATVPTVNTVINTSASNSTYHLYNTNATNNGYRFYVSANGGISNFSGNNVNLSDERTKKNIEVAGNYLEKICAIPVKLFNYKDEAENEQRTLGVVAQDVEAVAPEFVNNNGWKGTAPEDGVPLKTIYTTDMMFGLMKAIQEQQAIILSLKARLDAANL
jgi:hypothetical protein